MGTYLKTEENAINLGSIYRTGDLYYTTNPENPQDYLGGEWELFDYYGRSQYYSNTEISAPDSYISDVSGCSSLTYAILISPQVLWYRFYFINKNEINDTTQEILTVDITKLGFEEDHEFVQYATGWSDNGNSVIMFHMNGDGLLTTRDAINVNGTKIVSVGSTCQVCFCKATYPNSFSEDGIGQYVWKKIK